MDDLITAKGNKRMKFVHKKKKLPYCARAAGLEIFRSRKKM